MRTFQQRRQRNLHPYAAANVQFCRDRFRATGLKPATFAPSKTVGASRIFTRDDVLKHVRGLRSRVFREDRILLLGTGGSTGARMNYYKDADPESLLNASAGRGTRENWE